jgi:hypothetical protein
MLACTFVMHHNSVRLPIDLDANARLSVLLHNLEGEVLDILLNVALAELSSNKTLDVEDGAVRVGGELVLCGVTDKALLVVPCDPRRCDTVTLVVDEDLDLAALHDTNTRVGGSKIDTDDCARKVSWAVLEEWRLTELQAYQVQ